MYYTLLYTFWKK